MYISDHFVCFYAKLLGSETLEMIGFDDVIAIEKQNSALVVPNALTIKTQVCVCVCWSLCVVTCCLHRLPRAVKRHTFLLVVHSPQRRRASATAAGAPCARTHTPPDVYLL